MKRRKRGEKCKDGETMVNCLKMQRDSLCGRATKKGNVNKERDIEWCVFSVGRHGVDCPGGKCERVLGERLLAITNPPTEFCDNADKTSEFIITRSLRSVRHLLFRKQQNGAAATTENSSFYPTK